MSLTLVEIIPPTRQVFAGKPATGTELTQQRLKELLHYDPLTGEFTWLVSPSNRVQAGAIAGSFIIKTGYIEIRLDKISYLAHRLAWFYSFGVWPECLVEHENRDRKDNKLSNLREATHTENLYNVDIRSDNSSGYRGVSRKRGKWRARIRVAKEEVSLGSFDTPEEASQAYEAAAKELHGDFYRPPTTTGQIGGSTI